MKRILIAATALTLLIAPLGGAFAQGYDHGRDSGNNAMMQRNNDHRGNNMMRGGQGHRDWHKGDRIDRRDWGRYERVDYRRDHLRRPPRGYEWRRVDNNYVLAAVATGLIASVIAGSMH